VEMPGSEPTYKRECDLRTQTGALGVVPEMSCGRVLASPERAHGSTQLLHRLPDFQRFVD